METVKRNVTIDWTLRENVRAHLGVIVMRILRKYGYPPDKQGRATRLVLEQAAHAYRRLNHFVVLYCYRTSTCMTVRCGERRFVYITY